MSDELPKKLNLPSRPKSVPRIHDEDPERYRERVRQAKERENDTKPERKPTISPAEEYARLLEMRSGGRYVPPAKLRALELELNLVDDEKTKQQEQWNILRRNIQGSINKVNYNNIKIIITNLLENNLIRGRGIFCRSIMRAQALAQPFTPVYAALVAVINTKVPQVGELLLKRLVIQFRRGFRLNNKAQCLSSAIFIAHLCNQLVAEEIIALELLFLLLDKPTDDSVEIAVAFMKEVGAFLEEYSKKGSEGVFERFRAILHEGTLEKRTQYMIEVLFQIRKDLFKDNQIIPPELDLVVEGEEITHMIGLDEPLKGEEILNVFKFDPEYEKNEQYYEKIKHEIFGEDSEEDGSGSEVENESDDSVSASEDEEDIPPVPSSNDNQGPMVIKDMTNIELTTLRKTIYLTIMSSMSVDEAAHKLLRVKVPEGKEIEIVNMIIECCSQEKIYNKTYGSVALRFCLKGRFWRDLFSQAFTTYYTTIHRYETNQIRNIATLFGYILASDGLGWEVFECVHLTEEDSNSSSRIFLKILLQEVRQELGLQEMATRFKDEYLQESLVNMFPKGKSADTRFSINYFTAIGLGILTEGMREYLENRPPTPPPVTTRSISRSVESRGRSVSRTPSVSRSRSHTPERRRRGSYSQSPRSDRSRSYSYSRSPSYDSYGRRRSSQSPSRSRDYSGSSRSRSHSRSRSYSSRSRSYSGSRSPSYSRSRSGSFVSRERSYTPPPRRRRNVDEDIDNNGEPRKGRLIHGREMAPVSPNRYPEEYGQRVPLQASRKRQHSSSPEGKHLGTRNNTNQNGETKISRSPPTKKPLSSSTNDKPEAKAFAARDEVKRRAKASDYL